MIPYISMPGAQAPLPVQTSSIAGVPTQISTIKLPIDAVPSTLNAEVVYNNMRGGAGPQMSGSLGAASMIGGNSTLMPLMAGLDFRPSVQFSSPFLTQLFAQTSGSELQALSGFFMNDNIPKSIADPALMALYSQVKYKPSNASLGILDTRKNFEVMQNQQQHFMQQLTDQKQQMLQNQIRSEPATGGAQQTSIAQASFQAVPIRISQPAMHTPAATSTRASATYSPQPFRSLVKPTGIDAYFASFARNIANLTYPTDAVKVAL